MHRNGFATRFAGPSYRLVSEIVPPLHLKSRRGFLHSARSISLAVAWHARPSLSRSATARSRPSPMSVLTDPSDPVLRRSRCAAPASSTQPLDLPPPAPRLPLPLPLPPPSIPSVRSLPSGPSLPPGCTSRSVQGPAFSIRLHPFGVHHPRCPGPHSHQLTVLSGIGGSLVRDHARGRQSPLTRPVAKRHRRACRVA
jgi:hypothetical protein